MRRKLKYHVACTVSGEALKRSGVFVRRQHRLALVPLFFVFLVIYNCGHSPSDDMPTEQAAIENTVIQFSAALAAGDSTRLRALTGKSFVLLDEGRFYNFSELIAWRRLFSNVSENSGKSCK